MPIGATESGRVVYEPAPEDRLHSDSSMQVKKPQWDVFFYFWIVIFLRSFPARSSKMERLAINLHYNLFWVIL